jgi:UDP-glucose 4-epimerase
VGIFNVGTGIETNVLDLGRMIGEACNRPFEPEMAPPRPGEVQRIAIESSNAEREFGWRARTSLEDGLGRTAQAFAES